MNASLCGPFFNYYLGEIHITIYTRISSFLFRGLLTLGVIEVPWANPKFRQALSVTDLILVAVGNHLGALFLCHHGFQYLMQR